MKTLAQQYYETKAAHDRARLRHPHGATTLRLRFKMEGLMTRMLRNEVHRTTAVVSTSNGHQRAECA